MKEWASRVAVVLGGAFAGIVTMLLFFWTLFWALHFLITWLPWPWVWPA